MKIAVIETGGKQYKVQEGAIIKVEKLAPPAEGKSEVLFDRVLLIDDGKTTQVGAPTIAGAKVTAEYLKTDRAAKVTVIKFKSKSNYRVKYGHRQPFTEVKISKISN
jgi:large subunit ribosomal protein L21